jgi:hypothetical protein
VGKGSDTYGKRKGAHRGLVGKTEKEKRHFERPRCRWEDKVKTYVKEIGRGECGLY